MEGKAREGKKKGGGELEGGGRSDPHAKIVAIRHCTREMNLDDVTV